MSIGQAQVHPTDVSVLPQRYGSEYRSAFFINHKKSPSPCVREGLFLEPQDATRFALESLKETT